MKDLLFIGNIQLGESPTGGGAQARNQIFLRFLQFRFNNVAYYDTWHKNKIISLILIFFKILFTKKRNIILSLSFGGVYILSRILSNLKIKRNIHYWVIGGDIGDRIRNAGSSAVSNLSCYKNIIVQAEYIAVDLENLGVSNVYVVPNFKELSDMLIEKQDNDKIRFVFLSRLIQEKGVGIIIEAARQLGVDGFEIDFYGSQSLQYNKDYFDKLNLPNVKYKGFLNLESEQGYAILASYDIMLFPTYFEGEGFPGVLIDAFVAGLPIIASDFHANPEIVINGENGVIIEPNNIEALKVVMNQFISKKYDLNVMKARAKESAAKFAVQNVLNDNVFLKLGIL
jgi:glycosyltransferase involved in cell wall biosynthesis